MIILKVIIRNLIRTLSKIIKKLKALEYESYRRNRHLEEVRDKARIQYFTFGRGGFL